MIGDLKPYAEYKASELPWLGELPSHWKVVRNGNLFAQRNQTGFGHLPILEVSLKTGIRVRDFESPTRKQVMSDFGKYKRAAKGDIAYNMMRMWQGALGVAPVEGLVSPAYVVAAPYPNVTASYYSYLFRTDMYLGEIDACSRGIVKDRNRLYWEQFKQMASVFPPPDEQAAIVRFLDHATRRLERAIRAKRKLIALLNEQKQAIIHRAVTRGLDPNAPMKPLGIPWLGEIPAHWEARRLKQCITTIEQGWSPQCDAQPAGEGEWGVLKVGCVNKEAFNSDQNKKLPLSLSPEVNLEIRDGDILVSRANTRELLGLAALAETPRPKLILSDKLFRFRAFPAYFNSRFLIYALRCKPSRAQIESSTNGASSSMQNIGQGVLKNLWVTMPPVNEQTKIVAAIFEETCGLDNTISRAEREIALLREYRTRLIADVVTGKVDVREAAASLAGEGDESDLEDAPLEDETDALENDDEVLGDEQ
ncbi:MAG: restriction endonuclease subunit S [Blastocatellia bacterium]|nr:restriction endonuclease subunit S [Blastocatellia bacterium]